jgi:hypothetical protein
VPAEVDLVEAVVVREEDDLGRHLGLGRRARAGVELAEQLVPRLEPARGDDDGGEVDVDLVARLHERVDGGDAVLDGMGAHVDEPGHVARHEREAHARAAARVVAEQLGVDRLGGERRLGPVRAREELDVVADGVRHPRVDGAVGVLADVVDPVDRVALVGLGLAPWRAMWRSVARRICSALAKTVIGLAKPLRRGT